MKVILQKDVPNLGRKLDTKEVSDGYALNLLIPKGLAVIATPDAIKKFSVEKAKIEGDKKVQEELLIKNINSLDGITIKISGKANEKGHLFAGLHAKEIIEEVKKQSKLEIDPSFIQIKNPIKEIGSHDIVVKGGGKSSTFKLVIEKA